MYNDKKNNLFYWIRKKRTFWLKKCL